LNQVIEEAAESNPNAQFIVLDLAQLKMRKNAKEIEKEPKNHETITTT